MEDIPALIGGWKLHRTLSSGKFSSLVLSWQNIQTREIIVTKILKRNENIDKPQNAKWINEILLIKKCNNVNVISGKELPIDFEMGLAPINKQLLPVLCMEYCSTDLRQILLACENSCGLQEYDVRQILQDLKNAVEYLHKKNISHNNLKPENIVRQDVKPSSNVLIKDRSYIYKIIDIGLPNDTRSSLSSFSDERQYYAPEYIMESAKSSVAADLWSFGIVAFEIICGVRPFFPCISVATWMTQTSKKSHDYICGYETFHGDIVFSKEILPENHLSKHFKALIEEWLKIALEWQPQLRGIIAPITKLLLEGSEPQLTNNVTFFTKLDEILNTLVVKIFSVFTLEFLSYEFNNQTSVKVLKSKLKECTQMHENDQLLFSTKTNREAQNEEIILELWENNSSTAFFLYNNKTLIKKDIDHHIPRSVKRAISDLKLPTYNYNNSYELYRCGCFTIHSQKELCSLILKAIAVRVEYLHEESKQLLVQHDLLSKVIGKLEATHESVTYLIESGKENIKKLGAAEMVKKYVGVFDEVFTKINSISLNWEKLEKAWDQFTIRLHSCTKRCLELSPQEYLLLFEKYDFNDIIHAASSAYDDYMKNKSKINLNHIKVSVVSIKNACQDALKIKLNLLAELRHQPFVIKMMDSCIEISKLKVILQSASENSSKLLDELSEASRDLTGLMWKLILFPNDCNLIEEEQECDVNYLETSTEQDIANHTEPLVETSSMLRKNNSQLTTALIKNKNLLKDLPWDFCFLEDSKKTFSADK